MSISPWEMLILKIIKELNKLWYRAKAPICTRKKKQRRNIHQNFTCFGSLPTSMGNIHGGQHVVRYNEEKRDMIDVILG